jgi:hypothetical protein
MAQHVPAAEQAPTRTEKGVAMDTPEKGPTGHKTGAAEAKRLAIAVIGAGACIGVAVIAAALLLLF